MSEIKDLPKWNPGPECFPDRDFRREIDGLEKEIARLKEALEKKYESPTQQQVRFMKERNNEQGAEIESLRRENDRLCGQIKYLLDLEELKEKDAEIARLEAELKETNSQMAAVQYQSLQIAGQRDDLARQLVEAQGRIEKAIEYMKEWGNWRTNTVDITKLKQILQGKEGE